jgi:hypothetical protein
MAREAQKEAPTPLSKKTPEPDLLFFLPSENF